MIQSSSQITLRELPGEENHRTVIFGKYEMGKVLGRGTFAKVYFARNLETSEPAAIKVVRKDQVAKQGMADRIQREIAVMRLARHPNVVELREVMATKRKIYFVMELVRGGDLRARVAAEGRVGEEEARRYFRQLVGAVEFCHGRGIFHRDLKLENLLLDEDGELKVSDFGLSALPEQQRQDGLLHTRCGTPAYVAPEVLRKKGYDGAKADVWSCGVILYAILAGFLPFREHNVLYMYTKLLKAEYTFPPWIPPGARSLISKILVADPEKRISIPDIKKSPWFISGESPAPIAAALQRNSCGIMGTPPFLNAFELISSMASGFDLSSLFGGGRSPGSMFTSRLSAPAVVERLVAAFEDLDFRVVRAKEYRVVMQRDCSGGQAAVGLTVTAEVFEVAPELTVVELSLIAGDASEYKKFCAEDARRALNGVIWTRQGEVVNTL